jgi:hypothetical protein
MKPRPAMSAKVRKVRDIAAEMEHLFQRQIDLLKSETFVGLEPSQLAEYDRIGQKIRELFQELQNSSTSSSDPD